MATYKNKYKIPFRELKTSVLWEVYIMQRDYTGALTELIGLNVPLITEYRPEEDNDYDTIRPTVCTIGIVSTTHRQFIEFFTSDDRKYKLKVYKNSVLIWAGWLIPETYKEPYFDINYEVFISATDGLLSLKSPDWEIIDQRAGAYITTGFRLFMKAIQDCLSKLQLEEIGIWDASNIYEEHFDKTTSDSPLYQTYFNIWKFYKDGKPLKCYEVLKAILQAQNCQIWMQDGYWNIVSQNARKVPYVRRKYNWHFSSLGFSYLDETAVTTETYDPALTLDNTNIHFYDSPGLSFRPAWKNLKMTVNYGFNANVMTNKIPSFTENYRGGLADDGTVVSYNHYHILADHGVNEYCEFIIGEITADVLQTLKIKFNGSGRMVGRIKILIAGASTMYLNGENMAWYEDSSRCVFEDASYNTIKQMDAVYSYPIPISGTLKARVYGCVYSGRSTITNPAPTSNSFKLSDFTIELITTMIFREGIEVLTNINENNFYEKELELEFCDLAEDQQQWLTVTLADGRVVRKLNQNWTDTTNNKLIYNSILYYKSGSDYLPTSLWTIDKVKYNKLLNIISDEISVNHIDPQYVISGNIYGNIKYGSIITVDDKRYMILRASHNAYDYEWEVELFEIADTAQGYLQLHPSGYVQIHGGGYIQLH